jgi:PAS domain S-box-containing protein
MSSLPLIYFERLLEDSPDIVVAVDHLGEIVFYNDGARTALGYLPGEVLGRHVEMFYPSLEEAKTVMRAMRDPNVDDPGKVKNFQTTFVTRSGERIAVAISGTLIYDEQGHERGSIGFAKDLREIHRQDQLTTLGEIAVSIAHEINNPLAAIVNNLRLLDDSLRKTENDAEYDLQAERIDSIELSIDKIKRIVNRIAEMAGAGEYDTREYLPGTRMANLSAPDPRDQAIVDGADGNLDGSLANHRVLVVDDDLAVLQSVSDVLRAKGCEVETAANGREALERIEHHAPDLVLSDVVMPDLDGYDLYMAIRERHPELPVILMTAFFYDRDHIIKRAKLAGLEGVLFKKPVDPARLVEIVHEKCRH